MRGTETAARLRVQLELIRAELQSERALRQLTQVQLVAEQQARERLAEELLALRRHVDQ